MTATEELAAFAADLSADQIPDEVRATVRRHLLDALGCAVAATGISATGAPVVEMVRAWAGAREAGVPGLDFRAPAAQTALATGTLIHALGFDDTHVASTVHPSAAVVPAALAAAEESGADGRLVAAALAAGYEVATRAGASARGLRGRGVDPTGVCGPAGAAAAAGRLWGLTAAQMTNALALSWAMSGGLLAPSAGGSDVMMIRAGWAAMTGVVAADLARRGFTGPDAIAGGPHGFFDEARMLDGLGSSWETSRIAIKPYPACHFVHAYADAALRAGVKAGDVAEVVCFVPAAIVPVVCEPRAAKVAPETATAARFSLAFTVATAMVGGRSPLDLFGEEARGDRRVRSLAERVTYEVDESHPFPATYAGSVRIELRDGRVREVAEEINRGHPDRPLGEDEVRAKFLANCRRRLEAAAAAKLADQVARLEMLDDVGEIVAITQSR